MAAGTLLVTGPTALVGCTSSAPAPPAEPDPLEPLALRAESDVELAQAVAGEHPALAAAARALAADRQAHATALRAELLRVRPNPAGDSSALPSTLPFAPVTAQPTADSDQAAARAALVQAVRSAQDEAAGLVGALPGYRAALLASVAACCASHAEVL